MNKKVFLLFLLLPSLYTNAAFCIERNKTGQIDNSLKRTNKFIENKGQVQDSEGNLCPDIFFSGDWSGTNIFLRKGGISYVLSKANYAISDEKDANILEQNEPSDAIQKLDSVHSLMPISIQRVDLDFLGSNPDAKVKTEFTSEEKFNYYLGHCPQGITGVQSFEKVTYQSIYTNIDVSFYGGSANGLEYDFIVKPCGDPQAIQLKYSGADSLYLSPDGKLIIKTKIGEIKEWIPSTYQMVNGKKTEIFSRYQLEGSLITFNIGEYDKAYELIIDPWTTWITYYGGSQFDFGQAIETNAAGDVYISGVTSSIDFPVFLGFQMVYGGTGASTSTAGDAYLVKFNNAGTRLWATYYGGSANENGAGISIDPAGDVFLTGYTTSNNLPVVSGHQMTNGGFDDAFIVKFNSSGLRLWATYYGGTLEEKSWGVDTDASGNVIITGFTASADFPVAAAFQGSNAGIYDAFIVKLSGSGIRLWATYYGGTGRDQSYKVAIDASDNVVISGNTNSLNFPVLSGFQMSNAGGRDSFVVKFNASGNRIWSTYYGGSGNDYGEGITTDSNSNILFIGRSNSSNFPVLSGFQMVSGGNDDLFIVKLDSSGSRIWATYYGGNQLEYGLGITCDTSGNSYITGASYSFNFPVTSGSCQPIHSESCMNFLASINASGNFLCATHIGTANSYPYHGGISIFGCHAYLTGVTGLPYNFPTTPGSFQPVFAGGSYDAFVAQLPKDCNCSCASPAPLITISATSTCSAQCSATATLNPAGGTPPYNYNWSDGQTTQTATALCAGTYTVILTDAAGATVSSTVTVNSNPSPIAMFSGDTICAGENAYLCASGGDNFLWNTGDTAASITVSPASTTIYTLIVINNSGCSDTMSQNVIVYSRPEALIFGDSIICEGDSINLTGSGGFSYQWSTGEDTSHIVVKPAISNAYTLIATNSFGCSDTTIHAVTVSPLPIPVINGDTSLCAGQSTVLSGSGGSTFLWSNSDVNSSILISPSSSTTYILITSNAAGCIDSVSHTVIVNALPAATISGDSIACSGEAVTLTGSGGTGYSWNTGSSGNMITINPLVNTTYTLTVTDVEGCSDTVIYTVVVNSLPLPVITGDTIICSGETTTLTASGGSTYVWNTGDVSLALIVNPFSSALYSLTAISADGCTASTSQMIVVLPYPDAIITGDPTICSGQPDTLIGSGGITYQWSTGETSSSIIIHPASTSTYTLIVTDAAGCLDTASYSITVNSIPAILITGNLSICAGQSTVLSASGGTNYNWFPPTGLSCSNCPNPTATSLLTTIYTVTGITGTCSGTQSVTVSVEAITDTLSITTRFCDGDPAATLHAPIEVPGPYQWLFDGLPLFGANTDTLVIDPNLVHHYSLQWADNGCIKRTTEILISNLVFDFIPANATNVFSPNNDGVNDIYFPYVDSPINIGQMHQYVKDFSMQVFNRWGQLIFNTDESLSGWDGKNTNGSIVSEDVYYWIISYSSRCSKSNDHIIMKGFVQVLR